MKTSILPEEEFFTGAKTKEYAVFYNIAYLWIRDILKPFYQSVTKQAGHETEENSEVMDRFTASGFDPLNPALPDKAYLKLRDYLWKGYLFEKNSSGQEVTDKDKRLIHKAIKKLVDIRNFHSHYWHDNINLVFDEELKEHIDKLHEYALYQLKKEHAGEVECYIRDFNGKNKRELSFFDKHDGQYFITQDGRNFFLSLFLKRSGISRFMQQRKGCKRNDKPEYRIKHMVYRYYTHRDGASKNRYSIENTVFSELGEDIKAEIGQARQVHRIISYLNDVPSEMTDHQLFPLYDEGQVVEDAGRMIHFIHENGFFRECRFHEIINDEGKTNSKKVGFSYSGCSHTFNIRVRDIHKLVLDATREPEREAAFYQTLETFSGFREEFPGKLDEFIKGNGFVEEMNEYYTFKLKASDKTRGMLAIMIDKYNSGREINIDPEIIAGLKQNVAEEPVELTYHNFYFELQQKPRAADQFMAFAVRYLMDKEVVKEWEWLVEKFEPEETTRTTGTETRNLVRHVKNYATAMEEGYRLSISNGHALFRLKASPGHIFGIGQKAMRNLLLAHFHNHKKPVCDLATRVYADLSEIKQAALQNETIGYDRLSLLNSKTIPRYLRLMMRDPDTMNNETLLHASARARKRLTGLIGHFEALINGETKPTHREINRQLIRCYKYFDWNYPRDNRFKFLRQNEYQLMSIYHYTLAKPDNDPGYLSRLRNELLVDIKKHLPKDLEKLIEEATTLEGLFRAVLGATINKMKKWNNKMSSMTPETRKNCMRKLGIHVPKSPVPGAANRANLEQMDKLPFMLHPALVLMAFGYGQNSGIFKGFRENPKNAKGLADANYHYGNYVQRLLPPGENGRKQADKITGVVNNLRTLDTLLWTMAKDYLDQNKTGILKDMTEKLRDKQTGDFRVGRLHDIRLPVCRSDKTEARPFEITVMFKQLDDFMLITDRKILLKLARQIFNRYPTDEMLEKAGIYPENGVYRLPYIHIKQEMDRLYHESIIVADMILDWEKSIVDGVEVNTRRQLIENARLNNNNPKAYIDFNSVCSFAGLAEEDRRMVNNLRNHALHAKIPPAEWTYTRKLAEEKTRKILNITDEKLKKYEKKDAYYEAMAQKNKEQEDATV